MLINKEIFILLNNFKVEMISILLINLNLFYLMVKNLFLPLFSYPKQLWKEFYFHLKEEKNMSIHLLLHILIFILNHWLLLCILLYNDWIYLFLMIYVLYNTLKVYSFNWILIVNEFQVYQFIVLIILLNLILYVN